MDRKELLYNLFLEQMGSLGDFLLRYNQDHKYTGLKPQQSSDDPDSQRLLEAIAFFSARTYYMAERNMDAFRNKFYQQLFPYFLTTLPASGVIQATYTGALTEYISLEKGTDFILESKSGDDSLFLTDSDLNISTLSIVHLDSMPQVSGGIKLWLDFEAKHQSSNPDSTLSILIDYNGDTHYSFELFGYLRRCIQDIRICYGDRAEIGSDDENVWEEIEMPKFGSKPEKTEDIALLHPIERERLFFSDPRSELFLHVKVERARHMYKKFSLQFELSEPFPHGIRITRDCFQLHCVPILNLIRSPASGFICDGTQTRFPILHPDYSGSYQLFKVIGVYKITETGMIPLVPSVLDSKSGTYHLDISTDTGADHQNTSYIDLHYPSALLEPVTIHIDALWYQKQYNETRESASKFRPYSRNGLGVNWEWRYPPIVTTRAPLKKNLSESLLNLVVMAYKRYLSFTDLQLLFKTMGVSEAGPFKNIYSAFSGVRHEFRSVHASRLTAGYIIYFLDFDWSMVEAESELFKIFIRRLESTLNHLSTEREIHLSLEYRKFDAVPPIN